MHAIWLLTLLLLDLSEVVEADEKIQQVQYRSSIVSWFSKWDPRFHEVLPRTTLYAQYSTHLKTSVDQRPEWWIKPFQAAIRSNDKCNKRQAYMWNTTWTLNIQTVRINRRFGFFCQDVFIKRGRGEGKCFNKLRNLWLPLNLIWVCAIEQNKTKTEVG